MSLDVDGNSFNETWCNPQPGYSVERNHTEFRLTNHSCGPFDEDHIFSEPFAVTVFKALAYFFIISVSLFCNSLVIHIARISRRMQNSTNHFIINMAASDLLMTMFCMPPAVQAAIVGPYKMDFHGTLGIVVCKLVTFLQGVSVAVSVLTLLAISFDRFLAIVFPFAHFINLRVARLIISIIWLVSMVISAPLLYSVTLYDSDGETECTENWSPLFREHAYIDYSIFVSVSLYVLPLTGIAALYSAIACELWKRRPNQIHEQSTRKENRAVISMLVAIVVGFGLCWLPYQVRTIFLLIEHNFPESLTFAAMFLGYANSAVNPVILITFSKNYRQGIRNVLPSGFRNVNPRVTPNVIGAPHTTNNLNTREITSSRYHEAIQMT